MSDETKPDDSEPTPERQAELRAAYDANVAAGKAPYEGRDQGAFAFGRRASCLGSCASGAGLASSMQEARSART
jgi:hypothetical protein